MVTPRPTRTPFPTPSAAQMPPRPNSTRLRRPSGSERATLAEQNAAPSFRAFVLFAHSVICGPRTLPTHEVFGLAVICRLPGPPTLEMFAHGVTESGRTVPTRDVFARAVTGRSRRAIEPRHVRPEPPWRP